MKKKTKQKNLFGKIGETLIVFFVISIIMVTKVIFMDDPAPSKTATGRKVWSLVGIPIWSRTTYRINNKL